MASAWLKDAISKAVDTVELVLDSVDEIGTKVLEILEDLDDRLDRTLNDEQAQPAPQSGPVGEVSIDTMVDYIYDKVRATGYTGVDEKTFKSALRQAPHLTKNTYDKYKAQEKTTESAQW